MEDGGLTNCGSHTNRKKHIDSFVVVYKYSWMWWGIERGVVCDRVKGSPFPLPPDGRLTRLRKGLQLPS